MKDSATPASAQHAISMSTGARLCPDIFSTCTLMIRSRPTPSALSADLAEAANQARNARAELALHKFSSAVVAAV